MIELDKFINCTGADANTAQARHAKETAIRERDEALARLANLSSPAFGAGPTTMSEPPEDASTTAPTRTGVRRWFLLYAPRGTWEWVGHATFFASVLALSLSLIGVLTEDTSEQIPTDLPNALAVWTAFGLFGWIISDLAGRPATTRLKGFRQRWLLAFRPTGVIAWTLHLVYYALLALCAVGILISVALLPSDPEAPEMLLGYTVLSLLVLLLRFVALRLAQNKPARCSRSVSRLDKGRSTTA